MDVEEILRNRFVRRQLGQIAADDAALAGSRDPGDEDVVARAGNAQPESDGADGALLPDDLFERGLASQSGEGLQAPPSAAESYGQMLEQANSGIAEAKTGADALCVFANNSCINVGFLFVFFRCRK